MTASAGHCSATNRSGARCGAWALRGQSVCRFHGGKSPQALAAARRLDAGAKVVKLVIRGGAAVPPEVDALDALDWGLRRAWEMSAAALKLMRTAERRMRQSDDPNAQVHAADLHRVAGDALDRLTRIAKAGADAGVAERTVKVQEDMADQVFAVLSRVLADPRVALSSEQQRTFRLLLGEAFRQQAAS